jgi:hypothetical protein
VVELKEQQNNNIKKREGEVHFNPNTTNTQQTTSALPDKVLEIRTFPLIFAIVTKSGLTFDNRATGLLIGLCPLEFRGDGATSFFSRHQVSLILFHSFLFPFSL